MSWKAHLNADSLPWPLDDDQPGVRYLALRDLVGLDPADAELRSAR